MALSADPLLGSQDVVLFFFGVPWNPVRRVWQVVWELSALRASGLRGQIKSGDCTIVVLPARTRAKRRSSGELHSDTRLRRVFDTDTWPMMKTS